MQGSNHWSGGYGVVRPSQCAVQPRMRQPVRMRVLPSALGAAATTHFASRCISLHDMGPARKRSRRDVRPRTSRGPAHRISRHTRPARWLQGMARSRQAEPQLPGMARVRMRLPRCGLPCTVSSTPSSPRSGATFTRDAEWVCGARVGLVCTVRPAPGWSMTAAVSEPATVRRSRPHPNQAP